MLPINIETVKGFLDPEEGQHLMACAESVAHLGPMMEIGSYCGKSTVYLGTACKKHQQVLFAVDHHRGSEEHQRGEEYHDADLFDADVNRVDSFREFRKTLMRADLEDTVVPVVAPSTLVATHWSIPLSFVFIDGGHSMEAALNDYRCWSTQVKTGGILAIHDVFPNPADGGRPPFEIWELAKASGLFEVYPLVKSLAILRRR